MKNKIILILILLLSLCLFGCESSKNLKIDFEVNSISVYKSSNILHESEYKERIIDDSYNINNFINDLESIKYKEVKDDSDAKPGITFQSEIFKYVIVLSDNYKILIKSPDSFYIYENNKAILCDVIDGDFDSIYDMQFELVLQSVELNILPEDLEKMYYVKTYVVAESPICNIDVTNNTKLRNLLLNTTFYKSNIDIEEGYMNYYEIVLLNNKKLIVCDNGTIYLEIDNNLSETYMVINNEFKYLDQILYTYDEVKFNFTEGSTIEIKDTKDQKAEIKDASSILASFNELSYCVTRDKLDFELIVKYTVKVNNTNTITIYENNMFLYNDELYVLNKCNFDFINELTFKQETGWFPWV